MTDAQLFSNWTVSLLIAGAIVVAAAALLIGIVVAARRILRHAARALAAVERIKANTGSIWALKETNAHAVRIADTATAIRDHGAAVAGALEDDQDTASVA